MIKKAFFSLNQENTLPPFNFLWKRLYNNKIRFHFFYFLFINLIILYYIY